MNPRGVGHCRAVFLDRDGVLIRARIESGLPYAVRNVDELEFEDGVDSACRALREAGFALIVVTNQPEIARGTITAAAVHRVNEIVRTRLAIDEIVVCPHDDADGCACRKPRPGMLLAAARRHRIDRAASFMIGDRWRDVEAGQRAGCTTILVHRDYSESTSVVPDMTVSDVAQAADWIVAAVRAGA